jgi:predicted negative regulator of RcsB-dependent stress response
VDDYLNEQEQWDFVRGWLRQNGPWLVAGVALAAAGLWGWNAWKAHRESRLLAASAEYEQLVAAFAKNDTPTAVALADKLVAEYPHTGYAEHGQLMAARLEVENNQLPAAQARLQRILEATADRELALVVRLRIARLQIDQGRYDDALATLAAADPGAFAARYAEVRGDALWAKGDRAGALKAYREAQGAPGGAAGSGDLLALKIGAP